MTEPTDTVLVVEDEPPMRRFVRSARISIGVPAGVCLAAFSSRLSSSCSVSTGSTSTASSEST